MKLHSMLKRDWQLYKRGIIPALVLTAVFFLAIAAAYLAAGSSAVSLEPASVALVDADGSTLSQMAVGAVSGQDFISQVMDLRRTDADSALSGLESGKYAAVIILPEGYLQAIISGSSSTGSIILSDEAEQYGWLIRRLAGYGQEFVLAGQLGVFTGQHILWDQQAYELENDYLTASNLTLLTQALSAEDYVQVETISGSRGVSAAESTACLYLAAFLEVCALFFTVLFTKDVTSEKLLYLRANSVSWLSFTAGKIIFPFLFRCAAVFAVWCAFGARGSVLPGLAAAAMSSVWSGLFLMALPAHGGAAAVSAVTFVSFALLGGLVPEALLPRWAGTVGAFTPVGVTWSLLLHGWSAGALVTGIVLCCGAAALAAARLHLLLRKRGNG